MTGYASMRDRLRSDPRRDAHLDAPQWPVRRMATRAGTLARIRVRAAAPAIVEAAGRHAGRLTGGAPRRAPAADVVAEVGERAEDPRVASRRILTRHPHDESFVEYAVTGSSSAQAQGAVSFHSICMPCKDRAAQ